MKLLRVIIALFILCFASYAKTSLCDPEDSLVHAKNMVIGPYTYQTQYNSETGNGEMSIRKDGKTMFKLLGSHFFINPNLSCGLPKAGTQLTKNHKRELIVINWTGGAHCCYTLYHIALDDAPLLIQKIELEHAEVPVFKDLNEDGFPELIITDWTFAYWKVSFAQSATPKVILSFNGTKWEFDPSLNLKKTFDEKQFLKASKEIKETFEKVSSDAAFGDSQETGAPVLLWEEMLSLIYSGNVDYAEKLLDAIWPTNNSFKSKFRGEFYGKLKQSEYFTDLKKLNQDHL